MKLLQPFAPEIQSFSDGLESLESVSSKSMEGIHFDQRTFDSSTFRDSILKRCSFHDCVFQSASFAGADLDTCSFHRCRFIEPMFFGTTIKRSVFDQGEMRLGSFEEALLSGVTFHGINMSKTHFFNASVERSKFEKCNLSNTVLFNTRHAFLMDEPSEGTATVDLPLGVLLFNSHERGVSVPKVLSKMDQEADLIPIPMSMHGNWPSRGGLDDEMMRLLAGLNHRTHVSRGMQSDVSIAQSLLRMLQENPSVYPHCTKVIHKIKDLAPHIHSVVLPGGEDISPLMYGQTPQIETKTKAGFHRTLLELALIEHCANMGIPLLGICRGFQIINVYFGAQLNQHIGDDQVGVRTLMARSDGERQHEGIYGNMLKNLRTAVFHHQAVPSCSSSNRLMLSSSRTLPKGEHCSDLEVVMAVENTYGAPILGVQFHPEFFSGNSNFLVEQRNLSDDDLEQLGKNHVNRASGQQGLRTPKDLVGSGVLNYMSPQNDEVWRILGNVANTYRNKRRVF